MSDPVRSRLSHSRRGNVPFDSWLNEVARLLGSQVEADGDSKAPLEAAVAASLNSNFGGLSALYQLHELSPAEVVDGIAAAVAFAEAAPEVEPSEVPEEVQAARDREAEAAEVEVEAPPSVPFVTDADTHPSRTDGRLETLREAEEVRSEVEVRTDAVEPEVSEEDAVEKAREADEDPDGVHDADDHPSRTDEAAETEAEVKADPDAGVTTGPGSEDAATAQAAAGFADEGAGYASDEEV